MQSTKYVYDLCSCCQKKMKYKNNNIKLCYNCKRKSLRLAYRISAANYKNNKCEICGLERKTIDDLETFDFHHKDKTNKSFELGDNIQNRTWEIIRQELDKCMMLCANCHRKQHLYKRQSEIVEYAEILTHLYK